MLNNSMLPTIAILILTILSTAFEHANTQDVAVSKSELVEYIADEVRRVETTYTSQVDELRKELSDMKANFEQEIAMLNQQMKLYMRIERQTRLNMERRLALMADELSQKSDISKSKDILPPTEHGWDMFDDTNTTLPTKQGVDLSATVDVSPMKEHVSDIHETAETTPQDGHLPPNIENTESHRQSRQSTDPVVAFFATVTHNVDHLGANQDIVFDNVETNVGSGYNNHHGTFVAPVTGIYVINTALHCYKHGVLKAQVVKNGIPVAKFTSIMYGTLIVSRASQTVVLTLQAGDDVSVQTINGNSFVGGDKFSTFSGFLLFGYVGNVNLAVGK